MAENKAYITPSIIKWARTTASITEEEIAKKLNVKVDKLKEWEEGVSQPTISQAQKLAKNYKRPFALFFLPEIPKDFLPLQDFRKKDSKPLSTASIFIIREIQQKQAWISEVNRENQEEAIPFVGRFTEKSNPKLVAKDILETLSLDPLNYETKNPIKEWIERSEARGIFISRTSFIHSRMKLDSEEIQGFAIADAYAPFIFINSDDWDAPQLFTLVHELAHIWIAKTGISNETNLEGLNKDKLHPVELFCNEVAACALMPDELMDKLNGHTFRSGKEVFNEAKKLGVSSFAFLVRSLNKNIISIEQYRILKKEADAEYKKFVESEIQKKIQQKNKEKSSGPNYYLLQLNKNSRLFTQVVLDAFKGGFIEPTHASSLLNVQVNKFEKLENQLYKGTSWKRFFA